MTQKENDELAEFWIRRWIRIQKEKGREKNMLSRILSEITDNKPMILTNIPDDFGKSFNNYD